MEQVVRGALAGVVGTVLMTVVIATGRGARALWTPPPAEITANVHRKSRLAPRLPEPLFKLLWLTSHVVYGAACGVVYTLVRPLLPGRPSVAGLLYGGAVWGASYLGILPALGLYPTPGEDSPSRVAVMVAAHAVFGTTVAEAERRL